MHGTLSISADSKIFLCCFVSPFLNCSAFSHNGRWFSSLACRTIEFKYLWYLVQCCSFYNNLWKWTVNICEESSSLYADTLVSLPMSNPYSLGCSWWWIYIDLNFLLGSETKKTQSLVANLNEVACWPAICLIWHASLLDISCWDITVYIKFKCGTYFSCFLFA